MLQLTKEDIEIITHLGFPRVVTLSCGDFLIKRVKIDVVIRELLGEKIGKIMELKVPHNEYQVLNSEYYILSADLNKEGEFITATQKFNENERTDYSLYEVWLSLENEPNYNIHNVVDIIKIYIYDILFHNSDRTLDNWGFLKHQDGTEEVVMFDHEFILNDGDTAILHANDITKIPLLKVDFKKFLELSSKEFSDLFKYYYDLFTPAYFNELLDTEAKNIGLEISYIVHALKTYYAKHYQNLGEIYQNTIIKGEQNGR